MEKPFRAIVYSLLFVLALARTTAADGVTDGYFQALTYSGAAAITTAFGLFGTDTGSTLKLTNWSTSGYNFVYAPGTADSGTGANGAGSGQPNEAPGEYNVNGYGSTYMWGPGNGSANGLPATYPGGGNFIAADGAYQTAAITQSITGLTPGRIYVVSFYWAGAQQQNFTGATTEAWKVTLGTSTLTTPTVNVASKGFSGWMQQSFDYVATGSTETLSFLAVGTPNGQPPFSLLGGVSLNPVPEPSAWMLFAGLGTAFTFFGVIRRRRAVERAGRSSR